MVKEWSPLYAASNEPTRLRDIGRQMPRGGCGPVKLKILRAGETSQISADRLKSSTLDPRMGRNHDLGGEPFRLLSPEVAYVRIGGLKKAEISRFIEMAKATKGMVIDIRNYPTDFPIYDLGGRLTAKPADFAAFTTGDLGNPGAFHFLNTNPAIRPIEPRYTGKVAILVDESTQSSAEFHAMAFRAAGGVVVGSTTAAADGNVSRIVLPGGLSSMFTGIGVFYPDRKPTQRVGIVPDVVARPTIAGVAAGRDEVLEAALRIIVGAGASEAELRRIAIR
jgi:C-terminal processing protease CtpA/Prc